MTPGTWLISFQITPLLLSLLLLSEWSVHIQAAVLVFLYSVTGNQRAHYLYKPHDCIMFFTIYCQSSDTHEKENTTSHWNPVGSLTDLTVVLVLLSDYYIMNSEIGKTQCTYKLLVYDRLYKLTVEPSLPSLLCLLFLWLDFLLCVCENKCTVSVAASVILY